MTPINRLHTALSPLLYGDRFAVVPANINDTWPQRRFLRRLLRSFAIDCVLDVGANTGQFGNELRLIGYRGLIISFEPSPSCFAQLATRAASDPLWVVINTALGSASGELVLNEMATSQYNSFREPSVRETAFHIDHNVVARRTTVRVDTLDDVLPRLQQQHGFARPFLKMDTQGFDIEVFRGGATIHNRLIGLQSELSFKRFYEDAPHWIDALAEYEAGGFDLVGLYKVNPHDLRFIECDCYMMRAGLAPTRPG